MMETTEKPVSKIWYSAIASILLTTALLFIGQIAAYEFELFLCKVTPGTELWSTAISYLGFAGIWAVLILAMLANKRTRPFLRKLGPNSGNTWKGILIGALIGFATNTVCVLSAVICKKIYLSPSNETTVAGLIFVLFCVLVQSGAEELVCRLYLYQRLKLRYPSEIPSIVISALFFAIIHIFNPGVSPLAIFSIAVIGFQYAAIIYYFDDFWACSFVHALWNFTQNIIFGLPNSGMIAQYSIFTLDAAEDIDSFVYNSKFGVEETWLAIIVNLIVLALIVYFGQKKKKSEKEAHAEKIETAELSGVEQ